MEIICVILHRTNVLLSVGDSEGMGMEKVKNYSRYEMKVVLFDIQKECRELKEELKEAGILVYMPFLGLEVEDGLLKVVEELGMGVSDCLLITNQRGHAFVAKRLGMGVVGCMEGNFEVPKTDVLLENPEEVSVNYLNLVYCHASGLPAVLAETERCFIRELTKEDMSVLYDILIEKEVAQFLPKKFGTREEELDKLVAYTSYVYVFYEYGYWGIFLKETGELIGRAGFKEGSWPLEAGYVIKYAFWGKGFATEVLKELIMYGTEELGCEEFFVRIEEKNEASWKVAKKCGFYEVVERKQQENIEEKIKELHLVL